MYFWYFVHDLLIFSQLGGGGVKQIHFLPEAERNNISISYRRGGGGGAHEQPLRTLVE